MLLTKVDDGECIFITDDWKGYHRVIDQKRLFTGKDLTIPIEQTNSDIRNSCSRFIRRHKASSRSLKMIDVSLKIINHFRTFPHAFYEFSSPIRSSLLT
jgi:IS1 family transposase